MMNDLLIKIIVQMNWQQNTDENTRYRQIYVKQICENCSEPLQNKKVGGYLLKKCVHL